VKKNITGRKREISKEEIKKKKKSQDHLSSKE